MNNSEHQHIVAFFDVDHTLLPTSTGRIAAEHYWRNKTIGFLDVLWVIWFHFLHYWDMAPVEKLMEKAFGPFQDTPVTQIREDMQKLVLEKVIPAVYPQALETISWHKSQGHSVVLLSASSVFLVRPLAEWLGVDCIATTPVEKDGFFEGRILVPAPYGEGKLHWATRYADKQNASLADCFFYTDSHSDMALLVQVGHPVAVHPDPRLARRARRNSWKILRFV